MACRIHIGFGWKFIGDRDRGRDRGRGRVGNNRVLDACPTGVRAGPVRVHLASSRRSNGRLHTEVLAKLHRDMVLESSILYAISNGC